MVHSDQGCQFTGHEWQTFNLVSSMSRRGNCHDNAVADIFNYIEMFYNSQRRHSSARDYPL